MLNACASAVSACRSPSEKERLNKNSTVARPGPRRIFLPALPNVYCWGMANAAVLNHSCGVGFESAGLNRTLGRATPPVLFPLSPVWLGSSLGERVAVNGCPDSAVIMLLAWSPRIQDHLAGIL